MGKKLSITLVVKTITDDDGLSYTRVSSIKRCIMACIYFLEDADKGYQFRYTIELPSGAWMTETFENEIDAVNAVAGYFGLYDEYKHVKVKLVNYTNSERGAMCSEYDGKRLKSIIFMNKIKAFMETATPKVRLNDLVVITEEIDEDGDCMTEVANVVEKKPDGTIVCYDDRDEDWDGTIDPTFKVAILSEELQGELLWALENMSEPY